MIPQYRGAAAQAWLDDITVASEAEDTSRQQTVSEIIAAVRQQGDDALKALAQRFGEAPPCTLTPEEIEAAVARVPMDLQGVLSRAAHHIRAFAQGVMQSLQPVHLQHPGVAVGLDWRPVERVGCYVPGGRHPLPSTALMTALTAQAAGVREIVIASPQLPDEVVFAGTLAGVQTFHRVGGAQAVAALAYGTPSIPKVDMVVGPGNAYVTEAKRQLNGVIGIDMLAGPSEVVIIADGGANPRWVALDLLAQAEHDPDARAYLLTDAPELADAVVAQLPGLVAELTLPGFLETSLAKGAVVVLPHLVACCEAANRLAPEHLELLVAEPEGLKPRLQHYGALFLGYGTPVPLGDYTAGPNHTLPTGRTARFAGGLTPLTFLRPQTWIAASPSAEGLYRDTHCFATLEGLTAHAAAAQGRLTVDHPKNGF